MKGKIFITIPQSFDSAESISREHSLPSARRNFQPSISRPPPRAVHRRMRCTSGAVIPEMVVEISVKVSQSKGWQVCVCERKKERGRVTGPSLWKIRFKDLPHEMLHRCGVSLLQRERARRWVDVVQSESMFGEREHALLLLTN